MKNQPKKPTFPKTPTGWPTHLAKALWDSCLDKAEPLVNWCIGPEHT